MKRELSVDRHDDKPEGARIGWRVRGTTRPFTTPWLRLREDRVAITNDGKDGTAPDPVDTVTEITYTYLESGPAVFIVPVTDDGRMLLIRQYRYTVDDWLLEVPAGGAHDKPNISLEDLARDELREETGATCDTVERVGSFYGSTSKTDQQCHVFLARGAKIVGPPALEPTERIALYPLPIADAVRLARSGGMKDGQSALSVLLCEDTLRRHGYLDPDHLSCENVASMQ